MTAGLFDTAGHESLDRTDGQDAEGRYRAIAGTAIAAAVVAALSPLAFLDWSLAVVPILGVVLGIMSYRTITLSVVSLVTGLVTLSQAYAAELPEGYERLNYGLLQPLPGDPPDAVPDTARTMDGRNVLLKGYMYPGKQQTGITQFLLVRDQGDCCFGGNPKITDRVLVQLKDPGHPKGIDFSSRLTKIAGRFAIRPMGAPGMDGGVLYHLEDAFAR